MAKKYSFQRNKKKTLGWVIGVVAVIAAIVIGVVVYNNSLSGDFDVSVPSDEQLNNIAANLDVLSSHTDKFITAPQEDGSTTLQFYGSEHASTVVLFVNHGVEDPSEFIYGTYMLPSIFNVDLGMLSRDEIDMKAYELHVQTGNENVLLYVQKYPAQTKDDAFVADILAEIEAVIAEGPVVTEAAPAETTDTTTEEVPAE